MVHSLGLPIKHARAEMTVDDFERLLARSDELDSIPDEQRILPPLLLGLEWVDRVATSLPLIQRLWWLFTFEQRSRKTEHALEALG